MATMHCAYGLCTSDLRYPERLPPGTHFLRFAKPGKINDEMIAWEKQQQHIKTAKAKRWMHACGRKEFNLLEQIKKDTYICSLHFIHPTEENSDPIIATSITERTNNKKRKAPKVRTHILKKHIVQNQQPSNEVLTVSATDENHHHHHNNNNNKATQTVGIGKAIVAAKIETSVVRNSLLVEVPSGSSSSSCCNRMSFTQLGVDQYGKD